MSLRKGEIVISGISRETKLNAHSLLDFKWCDHILNEMSWLRADTFSWQSGDVYTTVYNLLEAEYQNGTEETESGITFKRSPNGYKITTDENGVIELYNGTGVAWFYILDTENRRFKLPRTQFGFTGLRDGVGAYVDAGLPNIRGSFKADGYIQDAGQEHTGAFYSSTDATTSRDRSSNAGSGTTRENFDASRSNSIYGNSDTVQPKATQMYLYFYVGEFSQTATEQTAGITTEMFNNKADTTLSNINASASAKETIVGWGMPDYSAGVNPSLVASTIYTAENNILLTGFCRIYWNANASFNVYDKNNNLVQTLTFMMGNQNENRSIPFNFIVGKGFKYSFVFGNNSQIINFVIFPMIGG